MSLVVCLFFSAAIPFSPSSILPISLFELCPESKLLFGFPVNIDPKSDSLLTNKRFLGHASFLLGMIEKTVDILGEDDDHLEKTLIELGRKHMTYGVKPAYFPFMTQAIIKMLQEKLGSDFSEEDRKAWRDILALLIADIIKGERTLDMGLASTNKNITSKNWETLSAIPDYDEVAGLAVFEKYVDIACGVIFRFASVFRI